MSEYDPFIPYGRQTITESDIEDVVNILRTDYLTQGPTVNEFESAVALRSSARFGVAVNSATSALHIACLALGLGPGDRLWTSPTTFVASANCALYCGADVDFVDIDPSSGLMCVNALEHKLKLAELNNTLPKVLVPVHLCGSSCEMSTIFELSQRYGFFILEDASHAVGGSYFGNPVGSCSYSSITVFSFHPVKIITTGEGGLATTNDPYLAQRMSDLRSHGITKDSTRFVNPVPGPWSYEQQFLGFNYRMTDFQAALGLSQLKRLNSIVHERNSLFNCYQRLFSDLPVTLLDVPSGVISSHHLAVIRLDDPSPKYHRYVFESLRDLRIGVQVHYSPVHLQPYYRKLGFTDGDFPEAENYGTNAISLPLYPGLQVHHQERVFEALKNTL